MAFVGLLYAVAAPIQTEADGQAITYGKGQVIGGMMTAEITGLTVTNVATKLSRIKDKLKRMKKEE